MISRFSDAFEPLLALQRSLERAMGEDYFGLSTTSRRSYPPVSVFKGPEGYRLRAELPGVRREDIDIEVVGDLVRISGTRRPRFDDGTALSTHRRERSGGGFDRTLKLPVAVQADKVHAALEAGVLTVDLPLAEAAKPKKISIN